MCAPWKQLQPVRKHRAVNLMEKARMNVDHTSGVDSEEVAVIGEMVDRTQCESVYAWLAKG